MSHDRHNRRATIFPLLGLSLGLGVSLSLALVGCQRRPPPVTAAPPAAAPAPVALAAPKAAPAPKTGPLADPRYMTIIRPMLTRRGCDSGNCHGTFKGGGLYFSSGGVTELRDYETVLERIDRKDPKKSILVQKPLAQVQHNGGRNLADNECDTRRLLAWIGQQPDIVCEVKPPPQTEARFAREVVPALQQLGCATATCHESSAASRLDLSGLTAAKPRLADAYRSFMSVPQNHIVVWMSPAIQAAWGESPGHKTKGDLESCAYRRLHGYIAGNPEATCAVDRPQAGLPSRKDFDEVVLPGIAKRGCLEGNCHGAGAGGMAVHEWRQDRHAALSNYLALTSRVEDLRKPEASTLLRTVRNDEPHGGGQRLGGKGDCLDGLVVSWLRGRPVRECPPPRPPSFARFASEVQPVLDKMTCTQAFCHGESLPMFRITARPSPAGLQSNYQAVLKQIDYDFMPLSQIQLRMREPCAYATVAAWIEGKPRPTCTMHDPDPNIFPKRDRQGNIMHPKAPAGPPPQKT